MTVGDKVRFRSSIRYDNLEHIITNIHKTNYSIWFALDDDTTGKWYDEDDLVMVEDKQKNVLRSNIDITPVNYIPEPTKALRYDSGKPDWSLVHFKSLEPMVRVLEMGAAKYTRDNWKKGFSRETILNSAMRHLSALLDGEENDPESKLSHAAHVMCNMVFYIYHFVIVKDGKAEETSKTADQMPKMS